MAEVLRRVKPTEEEQKKVQEAGKELKKRLEQLGGSFSRVVLAGSAARNTNLRGSSDLDVFLIYPRTISREEMEKEALSLGKKLLSNPETRYAEHPYVHGTFMGVPVDLVPAYEMKPGERIKSATDRTPLHQEYVSSRCRGKLCDEVRILKAFLKGIGVYGAEIRVQGFSGYLAELLIIHYGSFLNLARDAADWKPPVFVPTTSPAVRFKDPLIVPDPVDPYRNVAAPVSLDSLATFVAACQEFLRRPSLKFFFPEDAILSYEDIRDTLAHRNIIFVLFPYPRDTSPDIFWGQLRHMLKKVVRGMERFGYTVLCADVWTDEKMLSALALELEKGPLGTYEKHEGPPVFNRTHSERFVDTHRDAAFGPWIEHGRWYVLRPRSALSPVVGLYRVLETYREQSAKEPLKSCLKSMEILSGRAVLEHYTNKGLARWVSMFILRKPRWL